MGDAHRIRGHLLKILREMNLHNADRRLIARCVVNGAPGGSCPYAHVIDGKLVCIEVPAAQIDPDDVPPLECPLRKAARLIAIDPVAL